MAIRNLQQLGIRHDEAHRAATGQVRAMSRWDEELGDTDTSQRRRMSERLSDMDGDFSGMPNLRNHSTPPVINTPRQRHCSEIDEGKASAMKQYQDDASIHHHRSHLIMENERLREDVKSSCCRGLAKWCQESTTLLPTHAGCRSVLRLSP